MEDNNALDNQSTELRSDLGVLILMQTKTDYGIDGVRRYIVNLLTALGLRGVKTVVVYNDRDEFFTKLIDQGFDVRYIPFPRPHPRTLLNLKQRRTIKKHIQHIIDTENISIIHAQIPYLIDFVDRSWGCPIYCPQLAGFPKPKPIEFFSPKLLLHPRKLVGAWYRKNVTLNFKRADIVLSLSEAGIETSQKVYGISSSQTVLVTQGIPPASPTANPNKFRNELNIGDQETLVICVARVTRDKGVEEFGEVARRIGQSGKNIRFAFIGIH